MAKIWSLIGIQNFLFVYLCLGGIGMHLPSIFCDTTFVDLCGKKIQNFQPICSIQLENLPTTRCYESFCSLSSSFHATVPNCVFETTVSMLICFTPRFRPRLMKRPCSARNRPWKNFSSNLSPSWPYLDPIVCCWNLPRSNFYARFKFDINHE